MGCEGTPVPEVIGLDVAFQVASLNNVVQRVQEWLSLLQIKTFKVPTFSGSLTLQEKTVCCEAQQGAMTLESTGGGSLGIAPWKTPEWKPQFPPWATDLTWTVFGRSVGISYGIFVSATGSASADLTRTKRVCQNDVCWGGSLKLNGAGNAGIFGSVPNPALPPECGPKGNEACNFVRVDGSGTTGLNVQGAIGCDKAELQVGHNGLAVAANFIVAEGFWYEFSLSRTFTLVNPGPLGPLTIPLPL
jgi:hypothetical protein